MIRRLLDREVARGTAGGRGKVSRAELLELAAQITDLAERAENQSPTPVGEDAAENVSPPPALDSSRTMRPVAPVVEVEAVPQPPAPEPVAVAARPLSVVERWVAEGKGENRLVILEKRCELTEAELDLDLASRGIPRAKFDAFLARILAEWLEEQGEPMRSADTTVAISTLAAKLREALASGGVEAVPAP